jgi:hypothetical protein
MTMINFLNYLFRPAIKFVDYGATLRLQGNTQTGHINGVVIASAATITVDYAVNTVSGTTQTTLIKVPTGFRGLLLFIPQAAWPLATGGTYAASDGTYESIPLGASVTCTANKFLLLFCDGTKLWPLLSA